MTQLAGYWPIRQQLNTPFTQAWTFASSVASYTFTLTVYDSPETMTVVIPSSSFTMTISGSGNTQLTATAAAGLVTTGQVLYYELVGTPSGQGALAVQHGPMVFEP